MLFSQRKGIKLVKNVIQIDSMDDDLRNGLWNTLTIYYWNRVKGDWIHNYKDMDNLFKTIWFSYFKLPLDTLDDYYEDTYNEIRKYFFKCDWYEVYDFVEFVAKNYSDERVNENFMNVCNSILNRDLSAYRFVGGKITQMTSEEEISEIEEALQVSISPVGVHLNRALELLADRKNPDYRNSIKEAISAVESLCVRITGNETTTLGRALNKIERDGDLDLHPDLKDGFKKLYSYTSVADGIRHSLMDQPNLSFEDAKFMLVSCSAFINYLLSKASKADINL
ncbi:MAG: hypothetical protein KAV40_06155 [Thermoplasmatales archaeon]|nr:hypothetical protein [Thermoplasmatales archaeon]